ncbi:hypothetical protein [Agrobacterium sp. YIC 4121]|uniref:hypothetical protein n=1 Tax=Agrobacterium sp. YIC 4121 TaxID=1923829 RepID=UPI00098ED0D9|nr:hypothetical protein [Agrobacterium sp. YIC 4121]OOO29128.1 hypothetical protein BTE54_17640 [Agrobacterium sp. YIC 4121]
MTEYGQAAAIAAAWGVDIELLEDSDWEIDTIDGNDGEVYGYLIRFDEHTDPQTLAQLGLEDGEFTRQLSINAFDEPEPDELEWGYQNTDPRFRANSSDERPPVYRQGVALQTSEDVEGIYSVDQPLPDISDFIEDDEDFVVPDNSPDGGERSYNLDGQQYSPATFRALHPARRIEAMVQWFHENYEDPAVRTPYESAEGGYQWIWGGPYDAREEIGDQFSDIADEAEIDAAVDEVEKDGLVDWAPKESPDDYDQRDEEDDFTPPPISLTGIVGSNFNSSNFSNLTFGTGTPAQARVPDGDVEALRVEMRSRLDSLEALIRQQMSIAPNRGHNHPPELLEIERPVSQAQLQEVMIAIAEIRDESESPTPQITNILEQVSLFRRVAKFLGSGPGFVVGAAVSGVIGDIAVDTYKAHQNQIYEALIHTSDAVMAWVHHLLPF